MSRRGDRDTRVSVLVKNLPLSVRPEDLRAKFERYGEIRDVYLPRDYHSGRPRGFGFVEFLDQRDADDAIHEMDGRMMAGREIQVMMSQEQRKTPRDMAMRDDRFRRGGGGRRDRSRSRDRRRSRSRDRKRSYSPRRRSRSRSDSRRRRSRSRSRSPRRRSPSPRDRSRSRSKGRSASRSKSRSKSRSAARDSPRSDKGGDEKSRSRSPAREHENGTDARPEEAD